MTNTETLHSRVDHVDDLDNVVDLSRQLKEDVQDVANDSVRLARATRRTVSNSVQEHPARTLGIAAIVGYILAAGIPRWLIRVTSGLVLRNVIALVLTGGGKQQNTEPEHS